MQVYIFHTPLYGKCFKKTVCLFSCLQHHHFEKKGRGEMCLLLTGVEIRQANNTHIYYRRTFGRIKKWWCVLRDNLRLFFGPFPDAAKVKYGSFQHSLVLVMNTHVKEDQWMERFYNIPFNSLWLSISTI